MLIELYNKIREQDRFSDVFKPISREERDKRNREYAEEEKKRFEKRKEEMEKRKKERRDEKERGREEMEKREKKKLEDSDYGFLYTGDIEGEITWGEDFEPDPEKLADELIMSIGGKDANIDLEWDIEIIDVRSEKDLEDEDEECFVCLFLGNFTILSYKKLDEVTVANIFGTRIYAESSLGMMELSDVKIMDLKEVRKGE